MNNKIIFRTKDTGKEFEMEIAPPKSDMPSFFLFSLHKSGSTLLNNIFIDIARKLSIPRVDMNSFLISKGYSYEQVDILNKEILTSSGYLFGGFRNLWLPKEVLEFENFRGVLLVRDPRDATVSSYFSNKYSHRIPKHGKVKEIMESRREALSKEDDTDNIQDVFIFNRCAALNKTLMEYHEFFFGKNIRTYRYEDVIFYKYEWIKNMVEFLKLEIDEKTLRNLTIKHDIIPNQEDKTIHVRQVVPGNYKKHFDSDIIKKANEIANQSLSAFGYLDVPFIENRG